MITEKLKKYFFFVDESSQYILLILSPLASSLCSAMLPFILLICFEVKDWVILEATRKSIYNIFANHFANNKHHTQVFMSNHDPITKTLLVQNCLLDKSNHAFNFCGYMNISTNYKLNFH